jgi:hypothetical protein
VELARGSEGENDAGPSVINRTLPNGTLNGTSGPLAMILSRIPR